MRDQLYIVVHEDKDGAVTLQLHGSEETPHASFRNLHGSPADDPSRVTLVSIDWKANIASVRAKDLPIEDESKEGQPDGRILGKGPIWLDKEEDDGDGETDS